MSLAGVHYGKDQQSDSRERVRRPQIKPPSSTAAEVAQDGRTSVGVMATLSHRCRRAGRPTAKIPPADPPSAGIISSPDYRTRDPVGARGARALAARILDAVRRGVLRALLVVVPAEPAARSPSVLGGRRARISGRRAGRAVPAPALASAACRPRRIPGRTHGSPQPSARVTVSRHASLSAEPALRRDSGHGLPRPSRRTTAEQVKRVRKSNWLDAQGLGFPQLDRPLQSLPRPSHCSLIAPEDLGNSIRTGNLHPSTLF